MIVVWVEAIAEVTIASTTSLSHGEPSTSAARKLKTPSSSSNSPSASSPAKAITAVVTET